MQDDMREQLIDQIHRERRAQLRELMALHDRPTNERVAAGLCITDMEPLSTEPDGGLTLRYQENLSKFRRRDRLILNIGKPVGGEVRAGQRVTVLRIDPIARTVTIGPVTGRPPTGRNLTLDAAVEDYNSKRLERAVHLAFSKRPDLVSIMTGGASCEQVRHSQAALSALASMRVKQLTAAQRDAFLGCLDQDLKLIQGPPGSGKTYLLALVLRQMEARDRRILVTAFSHAAIDHLLQQLVEVGAKSIFKVDGTDDGGSLPKGVTLIPYRSGPFIVPSMACIAGATVYRAIEMATGGAEFDIVAIDEAGQMPVPHALAAMCCGRRFILAGDHRQLGPIFRCRTQDTLAISIFEHLHRIYPSSSTLLDITHRLNSELCEFPSRMFYGGLLKPSRAASRRWARFARTGPLGDMIAREESITFLQVDHHDCRQESPQEAAITAALAGELLTTHLVRPSQLGIIAPHRAQIRAIIDRLEQNLSAWPELRRSLGTELQVETIERFQGQEREIIILSLAVSDQEYARREAGFIFSPNRLNTAITRARRRLFVVASRDLFRTRLYDFDTLAAANAFKSFYRALRDHRVDLTDLGEPAQSTGIGMTGKEEASNGPTRS